MKSVMKKVTGMLVVFALTVAMFSVSAQAAPKGYQFTNNGVTITMNSKAKKFIKKAGKTVAFKATKSCAYKGKDRTYKYKNFILYTYSNSEKGAEYVNGITFLNNKVKTKEGITIGSSLEDVQKAYGKGSEKFGVYSFTKGKSKLQIEITDDKVSNLRYILKK